MTERRASGARVFHGPANIAGIGSKLARWQRDNGVVAHSYAWNSSPIIDPADHQIELHQTAGWRRLLTRVALAIRVLRRYDIFVFYFGVTFLPRFADLPLLRLFGKKIVMVYCGSDARLASVEVPRNPYSDQLMLSPDEDADKRRDMDTVARWGHVALAPRNLHASVSEVWDPARIVQDIWVHNAVDLAEFELERATTNRTPIIVHAPSDRALKGTRHVEACLRELHRRGYRFRYQRLEQVPHDEVTAMLASADVVVDQLLVGGFGTLAVEAMAWGKPVCGFLIEDVRQQFFPDCPIVNVTVDDLADRLGWLLDHPELRLDLGRSGREFVEKHLSLEVVGPRFNRLLSSL